MTRLVFAFLFLFTIAINAQDNSINKEVMSEFYELSIGDVFEFEDYKIQFVDVLSDNRCPKDVMCVIAGEAIVFLDIFKNNKKLTTKALSFTPTVFLPNNKGNLYDRELLKITGVALYPYPVAANQIQKENYSLKLLIEELVE